MKSNLKGQREDSKSGSWGAGQDPQRAALLTAPGGAICMDYNDPGGPGVSLAHLLPV